MTPYNFDMSTEKEPNIRRLLPEGKRPSKIIACEEKTSKAGNLMFVIDFEDNETKYVTTSYAVAVKGKRWFLKSILAACSVDPTNWEIDQIVGKGVICDIVHEDNSYINREGEEKFDKQHKVVNVEAEEWDKEL